MAKVFNTTAVCIPQQHYMVKLDSRLGKIKVLVDSGKYFTVNRARQYGKTTVLTALEQYLQDDYYVVFLDFQMVSSAKFQNEHTFSTAFAKLFLRELKRNRLTEEKRFCTAVCALASHMEKGGQAYELPELFDDLREICAASDKPLVLMIDEIDCVSDNQVFLDFLAQLRAGYIRRAVQPAFQSVILAGVYDVRNLKRRLCPEDAHKSNSPWNIAADFTVEMAFSREDIAGMLMEYENDYHTGMHIDEMAAMLFDYTAGYPFLVSRLCKLMDEEVCAREGSCIKGAAWTRDGFLEAVRIILNEKNTLFESLIGKLTGFPQLDRMLQSLLFRGKSIVYNADEPVIDIAAMFGFVKEHHGAAVVANRIFETRLYNYYLSAARMQELAIYQASLQDKNQFLTDGRLNIRRVLEKFVQHFHELYGGRKENFVEDEGRKYFLLYLRPIINGTGNYYVESRTRGLRRTDVVIDYRGEQYVVEMKIWHGEEYNRRGEKQLVSYLDDYHKSEGYMVSFNFNKKKQIGVHEIVVDGKTLIEAIV